VLLFVHAFEVSPCAQLQRDCLPYEPHMSNA